MNAFWKTTLNKCNYESVTCQLSMHLSRSFSTRQGEKLFATSLAFELSLGKSDTALEDLIEIP